MHVYYAHLCEMAFLAQNGNLNLISIIEKVSAPSFPAMFSRFSLVTSLSGEKGKHTKSIHIKEAKSNKEIIKPITLNLEFKESGKTIRLIGDINNLSIKAPGDYTVEIVGDGKKLYELPLLVEKAPKPIPQNR